MYKIILFSLFSLTVYTQNIYLAETNDLVNQNYNIKFSDNSDNCSTFTHVIGNFYKDKNYVYLKGDNCNISSFKKLDNIDSDSFSAVGSVINSDTNILYYAKDKNNIYIYTIYTPDTFFKIENVNTNKFEIFKDYYSKDDKNVFYGIEKIKDADPNTFIILDSYYSKDNKNVFYFGKKYEGVDAKSFAVLSTYYFKDNKKVFFYGEEIVGANPKNFVILSDYYSHDSKKVFWGNIEILNANPKFFKVLTDFYSHDDKKVFFFKVKNFLELILNLSQY